MGITGSGPLYAIAHFSLWLRYHTTSGASGTLHISEPKPYLARLATILSADFVHAWSEREEGEEFEIGISAAGVQFGLDQANRPSLWYRHLTIPNWWKMKVSRPELVAERTRMEGVIQRRRQIHVALSKPAALQGLREWASEGDAFARGLLPLLDQKADLNGYELDQLAERHLFTADDVLAARLTGLPALSVDDSYLAALVLRPVPAATDVFLKIRDTDPERFRNVLAAVQDDLDKLALRRLLEAPGPLAYAVYLRGSFNAWQSSNRFEYTGDGFYECVVALGEGRHEFKVGTERWLELNCGGQQESIKIVVNQPFPLFEEESFGRSRAFNLTIELFDRPAGKYRFVLDASRVANLNLTAQPV